MNTEQAILRSIIHNEIVHVDESDIDLDVLRSERDDEVENGDVIEFWGTDAEGNEWRVHVKADAADAGRDYRDYRDGYADYCRDCAQDRAAGD